MGTALVDVADVGLGDGVRRLQHVAPASTKGLAAAGKVSDRPDHVPGGAGEIRVPVACGVEQIRRRCDQVRHRVRDRAHQTLRPVANLGELAPGSLELRDEFFEFPNLVGDHRPLVAVHHRPQNEPDEEVFGAGDAEDAEGRDGRGQCKDKRPCNDSFFHHGP